MGAFGEELLQPFARERCRVRPCDADDVETLRVRGFDQPGFEAREIGQKSRLA
jgi:hypothetical protein